MCKGYMQLSREKIGDFEWSNNPHVFYMFFKLLFKANYKDKKWEGIDVKRGQIITSRSALSKELNLSEQIVRTCLGKLTSTGYINQQTTNKHTIITICDYDSWQQSAKTNNQQANQQITSNQPATNQDLIKEIKENKEIYISPYNPPSGDGEMGQVPERLAELERSLAFLADENKKLQDENSKLKEEKEKKKKQISYPEEFEKDFALYQRKGSKKNAYMRWRDLTDDDKEKMRRHIPHYLESNELRYLKDFEGYINQRLFESPVYKGNSILFDPQIFENQENGIYDASGWMSFDENFRAWRFFGFDPAKDMRDGYNDDTRPDGARVVQQATVHVWSAESKKWIKER